MKKQKATSKTLPSRPPVDGSSAAATVPRPSAGATAGAPRGKPHSPPRDPQLRDLEQLRALSIGSPVPLQSSHLPHPLDDEGQHCVDDSAPFITVEACDEPPGLRPTGRPSLDGRPLAHTLPRAPHGHARDETRVGSRPDLLTTPDRLPTQLEQRVIRYTGLSQSQSLDLCAKKEKIVRN